MDSPGAMVDAVLLVVILGQTYLGWRRGVLATVGAMVGLFVGGVLGFVATGLISFEPLLWSRTPMLVAVVPVLIIALSAAVGQRIGLVLGQGVAAAVSARGSAQARRAGPASGPPRPRRPWRLLGALTGFTLTCTAVWTLIPALRGIGYGPLTNEVAHSEVIARIDAAMPPPARSLAAPLYVWIDTAKSWQVLPNAPVAAPSGRLAGNADLERAASSVVKIRSVSEQCGRGREGSGWVVSGDRVVTNAHVVAGATRVAVQTRHGDGWMATVVAFDPGADVAVLAVPGIDAPVLRSGPTLRRGDDAAVAGYPLDGPYALDPARVRSRTTVTSANIYGRGRHERDVYTLQANVQQGNSGGPLLDPRGRAVGMVYAKSANEAKVGYALSLAEVETVLHPTERGAAAVSTGACTNR